MRLQILINHFHEDEEIVGRMLRSIEKQTLNKEDYEVLIGNDGPECELSEEFLGQFSFPVRQFTMEHVGVCHTRNVLLDVSEADWLLFCDADDEFNRDNGLEQLLEAAETEGPDIMASPFLAEFFFPHTTKLSLSVWKRDVVHVFGKLFRREYLIQNEIRFPDELETCGDMYFLWLAFHLTDRIVWSNNPFYVWKWQEGSVTRSGLASGIKNYSRVIRCYTLLIEELIRRNESLLINNALATLYAMLYIDANHFLNDAPEIYYEQGLQAAKDCVREFLELYLAIEEDYRREKYESYSKQRRKRPEDKPYEGLLQWIDAISKEVKDHDDL